MASYALMLITTTYLKHSQAGVRTAMIKCVSKLPLHGLPESMKLYFWSTYIEILCILD